MLNRIAALVVIGMLVAGCGSEPTGRDRPNVIVVSIDTLRADRVAGYGYPEMLTPNVERLVRGGVVFEHAIAPTGTTWPSHASMLTGLYPRYHGVRSNTHKLEIGMKSIAELLRSGGYETGSFVSFKGMHFLCGLDRGFDAASDRDRREPGEGAIRDGRETTDLALSWLDSAAGEAPMFLWLHLFEPHGPYDLTEYSRRWMAETGYDGILAENGATMDLLLKHTKEIIEREEDREALNKLYDGEVMLADRYFGEILARLEALGELENSVVVFTSDHGQGLGEQGRMGHGPVLWEEVLQVPLVVRDFRAPATARTVAETVGLVDIAPTVAELALDVPLPGSQGRSLVPALNGEAMDPVDYLAEVALQPEDQVGDWYDPDALAVYSQGLKFVFRKDTRRVFEIGDEPVVARPLQQPDSVSAMGEFARSVAEEFLAGEMTPSDAELTESDIEALRSLGYIQ
ncbi:MAG: sulfatase [Candidatus Wenzhouxiangella sp. M2_3B_020]